MRLYSRTNLGLCEVWGEELRVTVAVLDAAMRELGSETYALRPYENIQINRVAAEIGGATNLGNDKVPDIRDGFGELRIHFFKGFQQEPGDGQVAKPLVVGRNDLPGCMGGGASTEGLFVGFLEFPPELPIFEITRIELPMFFRPFDALPSAG